MVAPAQVRVRARCRTSAAPAEPVCRSSMRELIGLEVATSTLRAPSPRSALLPIVPRRDARRAASSSASRGTPCSPNQKKPGLFWIVRSSSGAQVRLGDASRRRGSQYFGLRLMRREVRSLDGCEGATSLGYLRRTTRVLASRLGVSMPCQPSGTLGVIHCQRRTASAGASCREPGPCSTPKRSCQ
jgi:hypothetical protein